MNRRKIPFSLLTKSTKLILSMFVVSLIILNIFDMPLSNVSLIKKTVAIIGPTGGGSGVIINSDSITSQVLTNRHVCEAVKSKGYVFDFAGVSYNILNFKESEIHDLCLITVVGDLKETTEISNTPLQIYDQVTVSGHPHLLPTTITTGYFTGSVRGDVAGKNFEMDVISALIAPGSSGSAVYNKRGYIVGLVFAGIGDLAFGMIVPLEHVRFFLQKEILTLDMQTQSPEIDPIFGNDKFPSRTPNKADKITYDKSN